MAGSWVRGYSVRALGRDGHLAAHSVLMKVRKQVNEYNSHLCDATNCRPHALLHPTSALVCHVRRIQYIPRDFCKPFVGIEDSPSVGAYMQERFIACRLLAIYNMCWAAS